MVACFFIWLLIFLSFFFFSRFFFFFFPVRALYRVCKLTIEHFVFNEPDYVLFWNSFMFHSKIERKVPCSSTYSLPHPCTASPVINIPHQSGAFLTTDEPTLIINHWNSVVYTRVHSQCHAFYAFGQILALRIPSTEELGGLQSVRSQGVRHGWAANTFTFFMMTCIHHYQTSF